MSSDKKALTSPGHGASFHIGDDDDMGIPKTSKTAAGGAFFSGWMTRLGGGTGRRGSVGFNEQGDLPPIRIDEDSLSNSGPSSRVDLRSMDLPIASSSSRERKISYTEYLGTTPGDDHDTYFYKSKFKKTDSDGNLQDAINTNISMSDNLFKLELSSSASKTSSDTPNVGHGLSLQTVQEGKVLESETEQRAFGEIEKLSQKRKITDDKNSSEDKIFLIDLEEMKSENGKTVLKPTTKKVSLGSMLQGKMTNNWFFRNKDAEEEETNDLVRHEEKEKSSSPEEDAESKSRKSSKASDRKESKEESSKEDGPILSKLKNFVDKNKSKHREMNFWQPQGS